MSESNRRDFLKSSLAVAGAGTLGSGTLATSAGAAGGASSVKPLKLGTVTYNLAKDWSLDEIFKNLEETGFEGVELRTTHAHGVEVDLTPAQRAEVKKRFEDSPIELVQLGSAFEFHSPDPEVVRQNIEGTKVYAQLAHDVGASGIKVRPNGLPEEVPVEKTLEQIGKSLHECGKTGQELGVEIRVECHGRETSRIPNMRKIMDYADHPFVVANWNSNQTDKEDGGFQKNFDLLKDKIKHVHIVDLSREDYPWRDLFKNLHDIGYQGYCMAEIKGTCDPIRLMQYYRTLFLAYQDVV